MKVIDFSGNEVVIKGYCHYFISPMGSEHMKPKNFFITSAMKEDELLIDLNTIKELS